MLPILITFILIDIAVFFWAAGAGLLLGSSGDFRAHLLLGLGAAISLCFTHILVMFYLIGSGKDIKETIVGIEVLEREYRPIVRWLKKIVFPWAFSSSMLVIIAAVLGAKVHSDLLMKNVENPQVRDVSGWWIHLVAIILCVGVNIVAFVMEVRAVRANRKMIDEINLHLAGLPDEDFVLPGAKSGS